MVFVNDGMVALKGTKDEIIAETTVLLHEVFNTIKSKDGEQEALEQLVEIGRLAVMTEEQIVEEVMTKIQDVLK